MSGFTNTTYMWYMFGNTGVNRISQKMLSYGENLSSFEFSDIIG
jgi:hypothetical protein